MFHYQQSLLPGAEHSLLPGADTTVQQQRKIRSSSERLNSRYKYCSLLIYIVISIDDPKAATETGCRRGYDSYLFGDIKKFLENRH